MSSSDRKNNVGLYGPDGRVIEGSRRYNAIALQLMSKVTGWKGKELVRYLANAKYQEHNGANMVYNSIMSALELYHEEKMNEYHERNKNKDE